MELCQEHLRTRLSTYEYILYIFIYYIDIIRYPLPTGRSLLTCWKPAGSAASALHVTPCVPCPSAGQGWAQIVAFLGTYELFINKPVGDEPGNYGPSG